MRSAQYGGWGGPHMFRSHLPASQPVQGAPRAPHTVRNKSLVCDSELLSAKQPSSHCSPWALGIIWVPLHLQGRRRKVTLTCSWSPPPRTQVVAPRSALTTPSVPGSRPAGESGGQGQGNPLPQCPASSLGSMAPQPQLGAPGPPLPSPPPHSHLGAPLPSPPPHGHLGLVHKVPCSCLWERTQNKRLGEWWVEVGAWASTSPLLPLWALCTVRPSSLP